MRGRDTHKTIPFSLKHASEDGASFEGLLAAFCNVDCYGEVLTPGCFKTDMDHFISCGVVRNEHSVTTGKVNYAEETKEGLFVKCEIMPTSAGKDQAILLRGRCIKQLSVGARMWGRWSDDMEELKAMWAEHGYTPCEDDLIRAANGAYLVTRAKAYEASTTFHPANERTAITSVKSADPQAGRTFDAHSETVLATVEEFTERAARLSQLRQKEGRGLSAKSLNRIRQLRAKLDILAKTPAAEPTEDVDQALFDSFLRLEARLNGVNV